MDTPTFIDDVGKISDLDSAVSFFVRSSRRLRAARAVGAVALVFAASACGPVVAGRPEPLREAPNVVGRGHSVARAPAAPSLADLTTGTVDPEAAVETQTTLLHGGWIEVTVHIPTGRNAPVPVVISPIVSDALLLDQGVATVHFRTRWEILRGLPKPDDAGCGTPCVGRWLLSSEKPENIGRFYFALIGEDALKSIPRVIDHLETFPEIDATRISIAGSSTSGFTALEALAAEPRLALGVVQVACGDYHQFLRSSSLALNDDPVYLPDGQLVLDPEYDATITRREPIRHADRLPPRPLLLMTGETDLAIPAACSRRTADLFARAYARGGAEDRFRFVEFAGKGHNLGPDAQEEALAWWRQWLLGPQPR